MTINKGLGQTALGLINLHFSVIPTNANKKATISWKEFSNKNNDHQRCVDLEKKRMNVSYALKSSDLSGCMDL